MLYQAYFSPTGGTRKVAEILAESWGCESRKLDLSDPEGEYLTCRMEPEDVCILAVPSFGGRVPAPAAERIRRMKGNGAAAVLVCVYGNRAYEDTLLELEDAAREAGFFCAAAVAAVAEHSIIHRFAEGRPDRADEEELTAFAEKIREQLETKDRSGMNPVSVPGNKPYREYNGVPFKPQPGKHCVACGRCASVCPVRAIRMERPYEADENLCISCMRCVSVCPAHARDVNKVLLFAAEQKMKKACSGRKENELFLD